MITRRSLVYSSILFLFLLFLSTELAKADNWNVGSGGKPSRLSLSSEYGPEAVTLLWQNGVSSVIAQQAVIDGNIVAMSRIININNVLYGTSVVAQDLTTGDTLWTKILPVDFPETDWRSRVSSIRNGVVYATRAGNTNYSYMYALDAVDGSIIWKSDGLVNESSTESCAFAGNGDLIVGNFDNIIRINAIDGTTVWETSRSTPTSNGQEVAVFEGKGYYWEPSPSGPKVSVIKLETGEYLYSSEPLSAGLIQQLGLFIGPDGTIYAPRSMNNTTTDFLFALEDTGNELIQLWNTPIGFVPFSTSGIGPDGTIYTYSPAGEVIRLDPEDGSILNASETIFTSLSASPRMAIDANGYVFVTNGEFSTGKFFSFNPDLTTRWTENITNVNIGGPAIGPGGTLVVCGTGTNVRAYEGTYSLQADFTSETTQVCAGDSMQFSDLSNGNITSWEWTFEGGIPETSFESDPVVQYPEAGSYDVSLTVSDGSNSSTLNVEDYLTVLELPDVSFGQLPAFSPGQQPYELTEGTPAGGIYDGPGVINGFFYPDTAGPGEHILSYYYENLNGCGDTAYQTAEVIVFPQVHKYEEAEQIIIYPNPANDRVTITFMEDHTGNIRLEVYDLTGYLVLQQHWNPGIYKKNSGTLFINHLSKGIFFLKIIKNEKTIFNQKLIKN